MPCEDAPCCGCCGPNGDDANRRYDEMEFDADSDSLDDWESDDSDDDGYTDAEADADTLASAGMGTDEDYGVYDDPYNDFDDYSPEFDE